ncbi:MAG: MFS transporter, partial [Pseudolabrys sp.]|nr:MFS transporter [Pseudolabrys sp.]
MTKNSWDTALLDASTHTTIDEGSLRYEGWRIVAVCLLVATFSWAFGFYGQSIYLAELHRQYGWPAALISGATTFFYLFGALIVVFVAEAVRSFGPRNCLIAGTLAMAMAAIGIGQVSAPWQLYLANAVLACGWAGMSLAMITNTLGLWFDHKRGMAISLALNGASFAGVLGVPLLVAAVGYFGFSTAMIVAAGVMIAVLVPILLIVVGRPPLHRTGALASSADAPSPMQIRSHAL